MPRLPLVLLACLMLSASVFGEDDPEPKGWIKLFNNRDLRGWKVFPKGPGNWKVKDGILVSSGPTSHLFSERGDYKNFHLRVEAKLSAGGNSGVYVRTAFENILYPVGPEAQIAIAGDSIKTGSLYPGQPDLRGKPELLVKEALHKEDEWFKMEVICKGQKIIIRVNGKETVNWTLPKGRYTKGHFALQQHNPRSTIMFRKIELMRLPDTE